MSTQSTFGKVMLILLGALLLLGGACFSLVSGFGVGLADGTSVGEVLLGIGGVAVTVLGILIIVKASKRR